MALPDTTFTSEVSEQSQVDGRVQLILTVGYTGAALTALLARGMRRL